MTYSFFFRRHSRAASLEETSRGERSFETGAGPCDACSDAERFERRELALLWSFRCQRRHKQHQELQASSPLSFEELCELPTEPERPTSTNVPVLHQPYFPLQLRIVCLTCLRCQGDRRRHHHRLREGGGGRRGADLVGLHVPRRGCGTRQQNAVASERDPRAGDGRFSPCPGVLTLHDHLVAGHQDLLPVGGLRVLQYRRAGLGPAGVGHRQRLQPLHAVGPGAGQLQAVGSDGDWKRKGHVCAVLSRRGTVSLWLRTLRGAEGGQRRDAQLEAGMLRGHAACWVTSTVQRRGKIKGTKALYLPPPGYRGSTFRCGPVVFPTVSSLILYFGLNLRPEDGAVFQNNIL